MAQPLSERRLAEAVKAHTLKTTHNSSRFARPLPLCSLQQREIERVSGGPERDGKFSARFLHTPIFPDVSLSSDVSFFVDGSLIS